MTPRARAWAAGAAAVACLAAWLAGFLLPWMDTGGLEVSRADLAHGIGYERGLVLWPAVALPAAAAALGVAAWALRRGAAVRRERILHTAALAGLAAGSVAGVAATRLLGLQAARIMDPGPATLSLLVPPYATLAAAAATLAVSLLLLLGSPGARAARPGAAAALCAGTVAALPLLPFGVVEGGFAFQVDEHLLALSASTGTGPMAEPARDLGWARALLWTAAALPMAWALAATWWPQALRLRRWMLAATAAVLLAATVAAALFQWHWWRADGVQPGWNFLALAGSAAALAVQARACVRAWRDSPQATPDPSPRKA